MLTLFHASDLHFGKHLDAQAGSSLRAAAEELEPDLIVLSGDFTQRAKVREYRAARSFLSELPPIPVLVTPGNHDVPLYRFWERALAPYRNYREFICRELDSALRVEGATLVALNSSSPYTAIVNGRIRSNQVAFAAGVFRDAPRHDVKILITHHNLAPAPDEVRSKPLFGHRDLLGAFEEMGVDLILGGHLHRSFTANSRDVLRRVHSGGGGVQGIAMAYCGTSTSFRGRVGEENANSFNLVRVAPSTIEVVRYLRVRGGGGFEPAGAENFPREGKARS